ncbi:Flavin-containing monooxygenase [Dirofilaria immitis]
MYPQRITACLKALISNTITEKTDEIIETKISAVKKCCAALFSFISFFGVFYVINVSFVQKVTASLAKIALLWKSSDEIVAAPTFQLAMDYFDRHCPYDYISMDSATSLSCHGYVDACTFLVAMVYLDRIRTIDKTYFESSDPVELYLSVLIIASKYLYDVGQQEFIYNDKWASLASISLKQVNEMELSALDAIHWNTNVSHVEFIRMLEEVETWIARDNMKKRGFCTYNETAVLLSRISLISDCVKPLMISLAVLTFVYSITIVSFLVFPQIPISVSMQRSNNLIKGDGYVLLFASLADNVTEQRTVSSYDNFYGCYASHFQRFFRALLISQIATKYVIWIFNFIAYGTGASGLPAIKECRAAGLEVVAYERTSDVGGLWNYRPELTKGGTVMKSTVMNTSKEMTAYSDFPPPANFCNFMHHSKVLEYLKDYARSNDLYQHICFNTTVEQVSRINNFWEVKINNGDKKRFDYVVICTGHHTMPQYPRIPGSEKFKGHILHSHKYRDYQGYEEKDIFIVGIGNSALDIASELSGVSKSVTVSTRRGSWIFNRVSQGGMPNDLKMMTRLHNYLMDKLPWTVANDFMEYRLQLRLDHDLYGLRPNHRFLQQHPTINDDLPNLLCSGRIVITEDVELIQETSIQVKGGRQFPADVIIFATGYTFGFPFLYPEFIIPIKNHEVELYKYVFPLKYPTLAVVGLIQPIGSILPISEMQCRWVAAIFSGQIKLPLHEEMLADIQLKQAQIRRRYFKSNKHTFQVDYIKYMDEIAEQIGCKPNLKKYIFTEPSFCLRLLIGANAPYVYRLEGPGSWDKAKETLITLPERVKVPLKNRECRLKRYKRSGRIEEYFRYVSMKWLAGWTCVVFVTGIWVFCSDSRNLTTLAYTTNVVIFFVFFSFILLWFDLQYDMSTIF